MRFKPRRNRSSANSDTNPQSQTLVSDRETLPFPEGGVFSAEPRKVRPSVRTQPRTNQRDAIAEDLDALFSDIRSGLDQLGDLLDEPFRLPTASGDDGGPRRAA